MQRIVHLDLKGAPWKPEYLAKLFPLLRKWGATGLLIEWEDTFPYSGDLAIIGSVGNSGGDGMYSVHEVNEIIALAKQENLEIIQLVQTIGHLEFALKHPAFKHLREEPRSPAVLCPCKVEGQALIRGLIEQALDLQPDAKYFHIGADEVWYMAVCPDCKAQASSSEYGVPSLFLQYIRNLVLFIKQKRPNLTVLMWDDMLRKIEPKCLKSYQLQDLVVPVLWDYNKAEYFNLSPSLLNKYKETFGTIWAASAFKGANGSCKIQCDVKRYVSNHISWKRSMEQNNHIVNFSGIILTGWSRYDHYATLCELLPAALSSLRCCLSALEKDAKDAEIECYEALPEKQWPGMELSFALQYFMMLRDKCFVFLDGEQISSFLNPWQIEKRYTNPMAVEGIMKIAEKSLGELTVMQNDMSRILHALTGPRSADEWIETNFTPIAKRLTHIRDMAALRFQSDASVSPTYSIK